MKQEETCSFYTSRGGSVAIVLGLKAIWQQHLNDWILYNFETSAVFEAVWQITA